MPSNRQCIGEIVRRLSKAVQIRQDRFNGFETDVQGKASVSKANLEHARSYQRSSKRVGTKGLTAFYLTGQRQIQLVPKLLLGNAWLGRSSFPRVLVRFR